MLLACVAVTGCGSTASEKSEAYDSSATASAMRAAGWQASAAKGMPRTVTGTPQVAYLQATTPAGHRIDVQS